MNNFKNILIGANDAFYEKNKKNLDLGDKESVEFCSDFISDAIKESGDSKED